MKYFKNKNGYSFAVVELKNAEHFMNDQWEEITKEEYDRLFEELNIK